MRSEDTSVRRRRIAHTPRNTGYGSDGKHTTFFAEDGGTYRVRSIRQEELAQIIFGPAAAFSLSVLSLVITSASGLSWDEARRHTFFYLALFGVGIAVSMLGGFSLKRWKELLLCLVCFEAMVMSAPAYGALLPVPVSERYVAGGALLLIMGAYAHQWKARAIWEPFVAVLLFLGAFACFWLRWLPTYYASWLFLFSAAFAGVSCFRIAQSANGYAQGWKIMTRD